MATFEYVEDPEQPARPTILPNFRPHPGPQSEYLGHPFTLIVRDETHDEAIDWHATMRDCVAEASVLATRIETRDSEAGEALQRLCNASAHVLDELQALTSRVDAQNRIIQRIVSDLEAVQAEAAHRPQFVLGALL